MEDGSPRLPFKRRSAIFEEETWLAIEEFRLPARGLFLSGLLAGFQIGFSVLAMGVALTQLDPQLPRLFQDLAIANAYALGFILVIMGRTALFTEYTTLAILPTLLGRTTLFDLTRLWGLVYLSNLLGVGLISGLIVVVGPGLGVVTPEAFRAIARMVTGHPWPVTLLSAILAGWLMGLLSWLLVVGRETLSQIVFIWLIAAIIGFAHLHHAITGAVEVLVGCLVGGVGLGDVGHFLLWTTLGNVIGGVAFAVTIRFSILVSENRFGSRES